MKAPGTLVPFNLLISGEENRILLGQSEINLGAPPLSRYSHIVKAQNLKFLDSGYNACSLSLL